MKKKLRALLASALAATLLLSLALVGCNAPAPSATNGGALEKTSFNLGHLNSTAHLFAFVAKEEGFFAEEGLDVTLNQFASSADLVSGLLSGQLDVSFIGSVPTITNAADKEISIFGGAMTNGHGYVIKSELAKGFKQGDISVLKGRTVASVKNSIQDVELLTLLKSKGLSYSEDAGDKSDVHIKYFKSQTDAYAALKSDEIDAASAYSPYTSIAKNDGYTVIYYCSDLEEFHNQPCCRQVAATEQLAASPKSYEAFERAIIKAYKFSQDNHAKTIEDVGKYIQIPQSDLEFEIYGNISVSYPDPDKAATLELQTSLVDLGYAPQFDLQPHYNTTVYANALKTLSAANPDDATFKELQAHFDKNN